MVEAFQAGDDEVFSRIVRTYYPSLLAEARRRLRSTSDAEDAVQETFLRAYMALGGFGGEFRLRAWLSRILANTCADQVGRRVRETRLFDRLASHRDEAPGADESAGDSQARRMVKEAVDALPESYRVAFILREVQDLTYAEVAEEMEVSEPNARARVHRARGALQRSLRSVGGTLGGFLIPLRLVTWRRLNPMFRRREAAGAHAAQVGPAFGPSVGQGSLAEISSFSPVALNAAPSSLGQISQALAQVATSPVSQTLVSVAPEAGRASIPVASTLATLAAAGAAVVGSTAAVLPSTLVTPAAQVAAAAALSGSPASSSAQQTSPASAASSSNSNSSHLAAVSSSTVSAPGGTSAWGWLINAASQLGSGAPGSSPGTSNSANSAASSTSGSSSSSNSGSGPAGSVNASAASSPTASTSTSAAPTAASNPSPTTGSTGASQASPPPVAVPPVACPLEQAFPGAVFPSLPPPVAGNVQPSAYFASDTLGLAQQSPSFEAVGQGSFDGPLGLVTLQAQYFACLASTSTPALAVDLSNPANPGLGDLKLAGAMVSSQTAGGETDTYYRGAASSLNASSAPAPLEFVGEVVVDQPTNTTMLRVALYGTVPNLGGTPGCGTPGSVGSSSNGTGSSCASSGAPSSGAANEARKRTVTRAASRRPPAARPRTSRAPANPSTRRSGPKRQAPLSPGRHSALSALSGRRRAARPKPPRLSMDQIVFALSWQSGCRRTGTQGQA